MSASYDSNIEHEPSYVDLPTSTPPAGTGFVHVTNGVFDTPAAIATSDLGTGSASSTTYLRGDQTWTTPAGGSSSFLGISVGVYAVQNIPAQAETAVLWDLDIKAATAEVSHVAGSASFIINTAGTYRITTVLDLALTNATSGWGNLEYRLYAGANALVKGRCPVYFSAGTDICPAGTLNWVGPLTVGQIIQLKLWGRNNTSTFNVSGFDASGAWGSTPCSTLCIQYIGP